MSLSTPPGAEVHIWRVDRAEDGAVGELPPYEAGLRPVCLVDGPVVEVDLGPDLEGGKPRHVSPHHVVRDVYEKLGFCVGHPLLYRGRPDKSRPGWSISGAVFLFSDV